MVSVLPPQPLGRAIAAAAYDGLVMLALLACSGLCAQLLTHGQLFNAHGQLQQAWFRPLQMAVVAAYLVSAWCRGGQTLGLRAWRLRLRTRHGQRLRWHDGLRRLLILGLPWLGLLSAHYGSTSLALACCGALWVLSYAWAGFDTKGLTLINRLAATRFESVPAQPSAGKNTSRSA